MNSKASKFTSTSSASLDQKYLWRPFTQMKDWIQSEPVVIESGYGSTLVDVAGKEYLDCNASIWTNLHGHRRAELDEAIRDQLNRIAHSSPLGLSNVPAPHLAKCLVESAAQTTFSDSPITGPDLTKVFFSDDGSTAMEVALKLSFESARRRFGLENPSLISVQSAYHGDTIGAVSMGKIDLFHAAFGPMLFPSATVMSPYCYRCPYNQALPERDDARNWRRCNWECVDEVDAAFEEKSKTTSTENPRKPNQPSSYTTFVVEPVMQGAAGMIAQPRGWLKRVVEIVRGHGSQWIADEVMTGFGRTGPLFAFQKEGVRPDFLALAKGLTGGYLPMAATLTTDPVFEAFLGEYSEFKSFFHGHSYTANQLGAAVGLASFDLLEKVHHYEHREQLAGWISEGLKSLWEIEYVGDIRQEGCVVGIELVADWKTKEPFALEEKIGIRVCEKLAELGVLTRPVGNVLVFMPPYCMTESEVKKALCAYHRAIREVLRDRQV
jgi:lysine---8-amino-7-oxononanoate aminotransferase